MNPSEPHWEPEWIVDMGDGSTLGVAIDDHCYVVLYPQEGGGWHPGTHMPEIVARFLCSIVVPDWANLAKGSG